MFYFSGYNTLVDALFECHIQACAYENLKYVLLGRVNITFKIKKIYTHTFLLKLFRTLYFLLLSLVCNFRKRKLLLKCLNIYIYIFFTSCVFFSSEAIRVNIM